ncbi:MAG: 30S ribosomal protein S6 [Phycisphaerae bacterium]
MKPMYEGLFLFDNGAAKDWAAMSGEVKRLLDRIEAELHVCVKFDERRLAYEIRGRKRGTYVLTFFFADPARITELERDAALSEMLLRTIFLRNPKIDPAKLAELKNWPAEQPLHPLAADSLGRRGDDHRGGRDRDRDDRPRGPRESGPAEDEEREVEFSREERE